MATIIETCKDVLKTRPVYEKREEEFYLRQKRKSELLKNSSLHQQRAEKLKPKAQNVFNAVQIIDNYSENYAEDMEKALGNALALAIPFLMLPLSAITAYIQKNPKMSGVKGKLANLLTIIPIFMLGMAYTPWATKKQIQASRTGRYNAIKNELSDVRNFVTYTPEQIEQARNIDNSANKEKIKKKDKSKNSYQNSIKVIKDFKKDYAEYKKFSQANTQLDEEFEKKLSQDYTPQELEKALEDRELIHNATKIINNKAEDYSENTENAYETLNALGAILSIPLGLGIGAIAGKFIKKVSPTHLKLYSAMGTMFFTSALLMAGTQRQKLASRVGRYMAEKEMKNDLSSIMYFDESEINSVNVNNDYSKRGFWGKVFDNLTYFKKYNKDCKEYQNYQKTTVKEQKKLLKNLKKVDITPEQLKEAEKLQKKVLFVFDELDEMSQSYSENVEAATDIAGIVITFAEEMLVFGLGLAIFLKMHKGKFKFSKIFNKLSNIIFDKNSIIRKSANEINEIAKESKQTQKKVDNIFCNLFGMGKNDFSAPDVEVQKRMARPLANLEVKLQNLKENPNSLKNEIKQNKFAQYLCNLVTDILKEKPRKARAKALRLGEKYEPKPAQNLLETMQNAFNDDKSEKMGKTLRNTLIAGGIPIVSIIFLVPFTIQSWFTNMQKKAGKIGVMKALDNVNDVRYYT